MLAPETEAGWRFSGLRSPMQSESKVLSSCITAWGTLLQPQSSLRNWDLVLSLSGTAVLNMISGLLPHSPLPRNSDVTDAHRPARAVCRSGSSAIPICKVTAGGEWGSVDSSAVVSFLPCLSSIFCSAIRWDPPPFHSQRNVSFSLHAGRSS